MPTPKNGYFLKSGERVPSVTTILNRFKDSGGLIHWAWQLGKDGKDYREERDKAADVGTIAHEMVDCDIHGREFDPSQYDRELVAKATRCFEAYKDWAASHKLRPAETEMQLVSERYRYGGTPDVLFVDGRLVLGDWKTSNRVYPEYLCQLAAYRWLVIENRPEMNVAPDAYLLRFDKEHGDFHVHHYTDLDDAWRAFIRMRELYDLMNALKRRVS